MNTKPFYHEMLETVLAEDYSKQYIVTKTQISLSSIRRILLGHEVKLPICEFQRLLYLYCDVMNKRNENHH